MNHNVTASNYYTVCGANGVIILPDYFHARRCQPYLRKSFLKGFNNLEEAKAFALAHLRKRTPPNIDVPDDIDIDEMLTIKKLQQRMEEYRGLVIREPVMEADCLIRNKSK